MEATKMKQAKLIACSCVIVFFVGVTTSPLWAEQVASAERVASAEHSVSGLHKFFGAGGWLVWVVLLPLSVVTIGLIIQYFLLLRRGKLLPTTVINRVHDSLADGDLSEAQEFLRTEGSFLSRTLCVGLAELKNGRGAMENTMAEMIEQDTTTLLRRIEWLNIIGNVAPMVGLFGTVWGMIDAFQGIVNAGGQPEPADLAGGISVALVTTWWGLVVAIPALATYGFLRNRIDSLAAEVSVTAEELLRDVDAKAAS